MKLRSLILCLAAIFSIVSSAHAADAYKARPYVVAGYNWTGFYTGLSVGYATSEVEWVGTGITTEPKGITIGGILGYNWQFGNFVTGLELDLAWADINRTQQILGPVSMTSGYDWYGSAAVRAGYTFGTGLLYVKGGYAYGHLESAISVVNLTADSGVQGWTYGVGYEWAFTNNWRARLEWQRFEFDTEPMNFGPGTVNADSRIDVFKFGVTYAFR